jgi:hypothetical protein
MALNWSALKNFIDTLAVKKTNSFLWAVAKKINAHDTSIATLDTSLAAKITGPASAGAGNLAVLDATGKIASDSGIAAANVFSKIKIGTITRNQTLDSGDVAYTGVGFKPREVDFLSSNGASGIVGAIGWDDGTTHCSMNVLSGQTVVLCDRSINASDGATWAQYGYIKSMDADGFTITWVKFGSPPAGTITSAYKANA